MKVAKEAVTAVSDGVEKSQAASAAEDSTFNRIFNYASFIWDDYSPSVTGNGANFDINTSR